MNNVNFSNTSYIYQKIFELLTGQYLPNWSDVLALIYRFLAFIKPLSILLSLLFLTVIIYCVTRIQAILRETEEKMHGSHGAEEGAHHTQTGHGSETSVTESGSGGLVSNKRWEKIIEHTSSQNPSDWRLAILECDIILDEMLTKMSYHGETLSDKLKAVEKSDFLTIDKAWEAHRVRNSIAHEGSNFQIDDREARRVVSLYEEVFKEFHYI